MKQFERFTRRTRRSLRGCAAILALAASTLALAEMPGEGFGEAFQKDFNRRDLPIIANSLHLDEAQRAIVETLFEQYDEAIDAGIEDLKNGWLAQPEKLQDPQQVGKLIFGAVEEWAKKRNQLRVQLISDIREQALTEEQQAQWPAVERRLIRIKSLPKGRLSGESIDLFVIVDQMGVDVTAAEPLGMLLEQYDVSLDQAIKRRDAAISGSRSIRSQSILNPDPGAYMRSVDELIQARVSLRDVNDQYATLVSAAMPGDQGGKFLQTVREKAYPRVYRPTQVHRLFAAAREIPGLEPQTLNAINELELNYNNELTVVNKAMVTTIKQSEAQQERSKAEASFERLSGGRSGRSEDPIRDEFRKREELNQKYMDLLKALLTPQQWDTLPGAAESGDRSLSGGERTPAGTFSGGAGGGNGATDSPGRPRGGNREPTGGDTLRGRKE